MNLEMIIRDHSGTIVLMIFGTIRGLSLIACKLWSLLIDFRCAFYKKKYCVQLETDNADAIKEWED